MQVLTSEELREKIDGGEKFIVDMYANWCGPCRILGPIFDKVGQRLDEENHQVKLYKFDIESDKEMAMELGVRSIPTIKAFSNGEIVDSKVGLLQEEQIIDLANSIL